MTTNPGSHLGYAVLARERFAELNADALLLIHTPTGAQHLHLATADDNNLFGVALHTCPTDSTGIAHILEHTVLCGSRRFPVRDPFFAMLKRSLSSFMNALTSSDWTLYPFSTQNRRDFYNLLDVYLDAVFFPLLRAEDFRQEGHRLEFASPDDPNSPLLYQGVVYNEMKGAMADPNSLLGRRLNRALYPTTTYGHNSGGEPSEIPQLTLAALRAFHAHAYHPGNAYFYTYGNLPLEEHLETIADRVLRHFAAPASRPGVADEVRFHAPRSLTETFPLAPGEPLTRRSMVQVAWLTCPTADSFQRTAMNVLGLLLLGSPAAPLYKALLDSRLGQNLAPGTGYHDDARETSFAAGLQGTEPEHLQAIESVVLETLANCARDGFPAERIDAALHQLEFAHREVVGDHYPYPLALLMRILGSWIHAGAPLSPLHLTRDLEQIRSAARAGGFFERLIRSQLLDNPHRVTLLLRPDPELEQQESARLAAELAGIKSQLTPEAVERILSESQELRKLQEQPPDLACLPTLMLEDIPTCEQPVLFEEAILAGRKTFLFEQPTNGIVYLDLQFPLDGVPRELLTHIPLFCSLLPAIGAAGHSYVEIAERLSAVTGGVRFSPAILEDPRDLGRFKLAIECRGKALARNVPQLFDLLRMILSAPDFRDLERLRTVIGQVAISVENSLPSSGHTYASRSAARTLTPGAAQREEWGGLTQLRRLRAAAKADPEQLVSLAATMETLASLVCGGPQVRQALVAEPSTLAQLQPALAHFLAALPASRQPIPQPAAPFQPRPGRWGWAGSLPVSYVARVFPTIPYTHPDAAGLSILVKLLRAGFLHREIREKGGAYGGMAGYNCEGGLLSLLSYRDPQLVRTLEVYREAAAWAARAEFSETDVKEAVLSYFSDLDRPLSPAGKASREFSLMLQGLTPEMRQTHRERARSVTRAQLAALAQVYLIDNWERSAVGVLSNHASLAQANAELGKDALEVNPI